MIDGVLYFVSFKGKPIRPVDIQTENRNDPNVNFGMYQLDREAKRKAQPSLPSIRQSAEDERRERDRDLEFESRQDFATWERDGDTGPEGE